ncbi:MAG: heparinase II/III family protein [Phycisphaerae bacterium]
MLSTMNPSPSLIAVLSSSLAAASFIPASTAHAADEADILRSLRREHPRLFASATDFARLKAAIRDHRVLHEWYRRILEDAEDMRSTEPMPHMVGGEHPRMAIHRIATCAGLYWLTGDREKAERARDELMAAAGYDSWGEGVNLGVAEMAFAAGLGYDWLHAFLTPQERSQVRTAIMEKALRAGLEHYDRRLRWYARTNNWNQVCNAGLAVGALAIADEEPDITRRILAGARRSIEHSMRSYDPDGGWNEGPDYWWYGTGYFVRYVAALESALGTDLGCRKAPGFAETGEFRIYSIGPFGEAFNFADSLPFPLPSPAMYWLARAFDRPEYAVHESRLELRRPQMFDLIWSAGRPPPKQVPDLPRDRLFRGIDVACFRGAWDDPQAVFVGFKAGENTNGHGHLDAGSFVLDALGERWAIDLGHEKYQLPGYFGAQRWQYFRTRNESHNTLTLDGENQDPRARAPIVAFQSKPEQAFAVAELSPAYRRPPGSLRRGIALLNRRDVLIRDELKTDVPVDVVWNLYTRAEVRLTGRRAALTLRGRNLFARILSAPPEARFEWAPAKAPPEERQQPDVQSLRLRLSVTQPCEIVVLLTPAEDAPTPPMLPLDRWIEAAPLK